MAAGNPSWGCGALGAAAPIPPSTPIPDHVFTAEGEGGWRRGRGDTFPAHYVQPPSWGETLPQPAFAPRLPCLRRVPPACARGFLGLRLRVGAGLGLPGGGAHGEGAKAASAAPTHMPSRGLRVSSSGLSFPVAEGWEALSRWNNRACVSQAKYRAAAAVLAAKIPRNLGGRPPAGEPAGGSLQRPG